MTHLYIDKGNLSFLAIVQWYSLVQAGLNSFSNSMGEFTFITCIRFGVSICISCT